MIKIGIEAHAIGMKQGGNERYIEGLLRGLSKLNPPDLQFIVFLNHMAEIPSFLKGHPSFSFEKVSTSSIKRLMLDLPSKIKRTNIDVLHTQYHIPPFVQIPSVITLHDVSYLIHPEFFPFFERIKMKTLMPSSIRKAKKIITVSQFSKREILKKYGDIDEKVCITYNGVSEEFKPVNEEKIQQVLTKHKIFRPYIISVSNLQPRKNLQGLISAYSLILKKKEDFPCCLVITGKKLWLYDEIFSAGEPTIKEKILFTDYVENDDLIALYSGAEMLVYPSFYEGFGLPVLEAMACGCPVIASASSSLPEIVEEAGILVDPYNSQEISSAILTLHQNGNLQKELKEKGLKQAKKFSWMECAKKTVEVYRNLVSLL
ncbi:MAG TPA: glycosyltransferase family 1 protein [bacterium]|nr:glycosyltransferase family 1 protein [bacterium]